MSSRRSPILMEQYLAAAESIAERAIVADSGADGVIKTWETESLNRTPEARCSTVQPGTRHLR